MKAGQAKPAPPWRRAEAGQYRSSDDRFSIASEGPSRWFVTDDEARDEFGLARTIGPFSTLDEAKAAAVAQRTSALETSPLAERLARAEATRGGDRTPLTGGGPRDRRGAGADARKRTGATGASAKAPPPPPPPPERTWLDDLADKDRAAARRARRLIAALDGAGVGDADGLVRRDVAGNQPVVAGRLLTAAILKAVDAATRPSVLDRAAKRLPARERDEARPGLAATAAVEAVLAVLGGSKPDQDLPGWRLVERDGPPGEAREIRVGATDLREAARASTDDG